jgi:hypothetical protein
VDAQGDTHTTRESGYCDRTTKTIYINVGESASPDGRLIIIHEICHAVTTGDHGTRFCARLRQSAQRAIALGNQPLHAQLLEEADSYEQAPHWHISPSRRIPEILCDNPEATWEQVLTYLADDCLKTVPELVERYPRLRAVYDRTRRQEITTGRYQLKIARHVEGGAHRVSYWEDRLRLLEAVTHEDRLDARRLYG